MARFRNGLGVGTAMLCGSLISGCAADDTTSEREAIGSSKFAEVVACPVSTAGINYGRELVITAMEVVNDSCRTTWNGVCLNSAHRGHWTFGYLMQQMAGTGVNASTLVLKWLESFESTNKVGVSALNNRTKIRSEIIDPWRLASGCAAGTSACTLDMTKAPFRLLAIVNRTDLRTGVGSVFSPYNTGAAGEARFVFGFTRMDGTPLDATVILEYALPIDNWTPIAWAQRFHALGTISFGETYNSMLTSITDMFAASGRGAGKPNGSAISQVRTNERAFDSSPVAAFELREQRLQCAPGTTCTNLQKLLLPTTTVRTPSTSIDSSVTLRDYMNNNMSAILAGTHTIPASMLTGASRPINDAINPIGAWAADAPLNAVPAPNTEADVRRLFALSTCNGCHSVAETKTDGFQIFPRPANAPSSLSPFLAGPIALQEPLEGTSVAYDEPLRRQCEFQWLLNGNNTLLYTNAGRPH